MKAKAKASKNPQTRRQQREKQGGHKDDCTNRGAGTKRAYVARGRRRSRVWLDDTSKCLGCASAGGLCVPRNKLVLAISRCSSFAFACKTLCVFCPSDLTCLVVAARGWSRLISSSSLITETSRASNGWWWSRVSGWGRPIRPRKQNLKKGNHVGKYKRTISFFPLLKELGWGIYGGKS